MQYFHDKSHFCSSFRQVELQKILTLPFEKMRRLILMLTEKFFEQLILRHTMKILHFGLNSATNNIIDFALRWFAWLI